MGTDAGVLLVDDDPADPPSSLPSIPQLVAECKPLIRHLPYSHELPPPPPPSTGDDNFFGCPPPSLPVSSSSSYSYSAVSTTNVQENQELAIIGRSLQLEAAVN